MRDVHVVIAPVGDDASGVLVPPPPAATVDEVRALKTVLVLRRLALVHVPIQLGRNRLHRERAPFGRPEGKRHGDFLQLSDAAVAHQFNRGLKLLLTALLGADLHDAAGLLDDAAEDFAFIDGERDRLFGIHVFAGLARRHVNDGVPVVRGRIEDDVDVLAIQYLAIVAIGVRLAAESFFGLGRVFLVHIAHSHDVAERRRLLGNPHAASPCADESHARSVVGRRCALCQGCRRRNPGGNGHCRTSRG